jgi:hypothetical protein
VYGAACIMCHDDATPHIMTHDAALIVLTSLSHGTNFTFILSTLSLSLYIIFPLCLSSSFKRRSGGRCGREERRRNRSSAKGPCNRIWDIIFYFFYNLWGLVIYFFLFFYENSCRCLI